MTVNNPCQSVERPARLPLCPRSPNCVSSQASDADHYIEPFNILGDPEEAWSVFKKLLAGQTRTIIVADQRPALRAEATSLIFRFVDDIDALLDTEAKLIHIRSASRVGYSDLGVNRKRVEMLRRQLQQLGVVE